MTIPFPDDCGSGLIQRVADSFPVESWKNAKVLVAVSGGPDSVALLLFLAKIAHQHSIADNLVVAHCNHQTGEQNKHDQRFVNQLSDQMGLPFVAIRRGGKNDISSGGPSSEESLRNFRYHALIQAAQDAAARYIVTGHTKDDQIETVLFRLCRGTGIFGLSGIRSLRVTDGISVIRPMLEITRKEILAFLSELNQSFQLDPSNSSNHYTRNFLRNEVLPLIDCKFGKQFRDSFSRLSEQAVELEHFLDSLAQEFASQEAIGTQVIDVSRLRQQHDVLIRHALKLLWRGMGFPEKEMTREKWMLLGKLVKLDGDGTIQLPGQITVRKNGTRIHFESTPGCRGKGDASRQS